MGIFLFSLVITTAFIALLFFIITMMKIYEDQERYLNPDINAREHIAELFADGRIDEQEAKSRFKDLRDKRSNENLRKKKIDETVRKWG